MTWEQAMRRAAEGSRREGRRWRVYGRRYFDGWSYSAMPAAEYAMMTSDDLPGMW